MSLVEDSISLRSDTIGYYTKYILNIYYAIQSYLQVASAFLTLAQNS